MGYKREQRDSRDHLSGRDIGFILIPHKNKTQSLGMQILTHPTAYVQGYFFSREQDNI